MIASNEISFNTIAMVDCGATASFIDSSFAQLHGLTFTPLQHPRDLTVADGRSVSSRAITHTVQISFAIGLHSKVLHLFATTLGQYPVVLGLPWLRNHDPHICFGENTITFDSRHCLDHCVSTHQAVKIYGIDTTFDTLHEIQKQPQVHKTLHEIQEPHEIQETRCSVSRPHYSLCSSYQINMADCTRKMTRELTLLDNLSVGTTSAALRTPIIDITSSARKFNISMIGAALFNHLVQKSQSRKDSRIQIFSVILHDINIALTPKKPIDPATKLPTEYHNFLDVFSKSDADTFPKHRSGYDHSIELMEGKTPTWGPLYSMSADELKVLKAYIKEMVDKGFIWASLSPAASPVLFAKKPGGGLRFCVDYWAFNAITVKNWYFLPLIKETLERVCKAKIFSKIDIIVAFNKLRIKEGEEWKTAFQTRYSLYKYLVMPFGLANGPSSFQTYINNVLHGMLNIFCTAYIDDILIYSNSKKEHQKHVRKVLEALQKAGLQTDIKKCEFHVTEINYLGLVITNNGICMDPKKVSAVQQ